MSLIFLGLLSLLLLVNLAGLALLLRPWLQHHLLAKTVGMLGFTLLFFFIEHFAGLGRLTWIWPLTTVVSVITIACYWAEIKAGLWRQELPFVIAYTYALLWKFSFPDIGIGTEQMTDLSFINNYLPGATLPPQDSWLPAFKFNMYYSFQHYGAALMARIMGLEGGYALNMAYAVTMGFLGSLAWFVTSRFSAARWSRVVLVVAIMLGGTGIAPLTHFIIHQVPTTRQAYADAASDDIWTYMRFAGNFDERVNTQLGRALFPQLLPQERPTPDFQPRDLPLETIGYLTLVGDFHPPLGGFLLLFLALACIAVLEVAPRATPGDTLQPESWPQEPGIRDAFLQGILVATVPLTLITNTWVVPLQGVLVMAWLVYRYSVHRPPDWRAVLIGGFVTMALIYPFFSQFAAQTLQTPIKLVEVLDHTPVSRFIGLHWPTIVLCVMTLILARRNRFALFIGITFAFLLLMSEIIYVDDPMGDRYNRLNTTLKWWSWIYVGMVLSMGSICLGAGKWARAIALVVLVLIATSSVDMAVYWACNAKPSIGKMAGNQVLKNDPIDRQILEFLKVAPRGVVLESVDGGAYMRSSAFALFSGQLSANGWPDNETLWRGNANHIQIDAEKNRLFFRGQLPDALSWLEINDVRYILWVLRDHQRQSDGRARIEVQISTRYAWKAMWQEQAFELGYWVRK